MKYRVYRKNISISYKDVEADSTEEAEKHYIDPREGYTCIADGYIYDHLVTDATEEPSEDVFKERDKRIERMIAAEDSLKDPQGE